ncbi:hypothetical protein [uncultured Erythrobacter sp.]|uniref:hypothetical protein n=1 Tax=uncultured Erythrobacter sp. TaxID=263913 RepID=UPI002603F57E|nr:hypothetical protein [uncultured Erythrobacter sp.]
MTSRFGFSELDLPGAPQPFSEEEIKAVMRGDKDFDIFSADLQKTMLAFNQKVQDYESAREEASKFEGFKVPQTELSNLNLSNVKRAVWLRLELFMTARGWRLKYTQQRDEFSVLPDSAANVATILQEAFHQDPDDSRIKSTNRIRKPEYPRETHLSISAEKPQLIMLSVSKNANLQFNRSGAAISTSKEYSGAFLSSGILTENGTLENPTRVLQYKQKKDKRDNCRFAYFIVDPTDPITQKGGGSGGGDTNSVNSPKAFNIHLDLTGRKKKPTGRPRPKFYIPIIIDPDVRHPGGFG